MRHVDNQDIVNEVGSALVKALNGQTHPGDKITTALSATFNLITSTAAMLMGSAFDPMNEKYPNNDHVLLASFLMTEACALNSDASVRVEFSPPRLWEALEDFKRFTGRDGEHLIDPNLLFLVKKATEVDATKFGPNSKFLQ